MIIDHDDSIPYNPGEIKNVLEDPATGLGRLGSYSLDVIVMPTKDIERIPQEIRQNATA